jgi:4-hydroxy-3-methylbut-2-enyl diphosphate reductase
VKLIRAKVLGFCKGVRRAVEMALELSPEICPQGSSVAGRQVYTLGPLIHNSRVLASLRERGIICLAEGEIPAENSAVIIRAHGVSPAVERDLARSGISIIDATCPHVKISQNKARDFAGKAYRVFLAGEENHAEMEGIRGYVEDVYTDSPLKSCFVVSNPVEAASAAEELYSLEPQAKTVLIGQTTIRVEEYLAIGEALRAVFPDLETLDTICGATAERQKALRELCSDVDAVIIVGSRESANTQRLLSLALELEKPAWLAETPADIPPGIKSHKTIGISAGASTPDSLIAEVEQSLLFV